jgi:hypothetical protein
MYRETRLDEIRKDEKAAAAISKAEGDFDARMRKAKFQLSK